MAVLVSGVGHLVFAGHVRGAGAMIWELLVGVIYLIVGSNLLMHPLAGLVTLTLLLSIYLAVKAVIEFVLGVSIRPVAGSGWLIFDAIISFIVAVMIWQHLPVASELVIGTLVGFAMLFSGISRLLLSLAARKVVQAV